MEGLMVRATLGQGGKPAGNYIQFGTANGGTIYGTGNEFAEMLTCRKVYLCCLRETRWRGGSACLVKGKHSI